MRLLSGAYFLFQNIYLTLKVIGPQRIFAPGMLYSGIIWFCLLGGILPILVFLWRKKYPESWIGQIDIPLVLTSLYSCPTNVNFR